MRLRQFISHRASVFWALFFLLLSILMAVLAPLLANDKPLVFIVDGEYFFPALSGDRIVSTEHGARYDLARIDFTERLGSEFKYVMPLVSYSPKRNDLDNARFKSPFDLQKRNGANLKLKHRHFLGTTETGQDVLAGIIHGSRTSLSVAFSAIALAAFIGLLLGASAGYFGNAGLKLSPFQLVISPILLFTSWFYSYYLPLERNPEGSSLYHFIISIIAFSFLFYLASVLGKKQKKSSFFKGQAFSLDRGVSRIIEVFGALPKIILVLSVAAVFNPSIGLLITIIAFTGWTQIARFTRAEVLKLKDQDFINALKIQGLNHRQIIVKHLLPNALAPTLVSITFGIASAILIESSLSFLNLGLPEDAISWGKLLFQARANFQAWWLVIFPGLFIFITIISLNVLGNRLQEILNPRLRSL